MLRIVLRVEVRAIYSSGATGGTVTDRLQVWSVGEFATPELRALLPARQAGRSGDDTSLAVADLFADRRGDRFAGSLVRIRDSNGCARLPAAMCGRPALRRRGTRQRRARGDLRLRRRRCYARRAARDRPHRDDRPRPAAPSPAVSGAGRIRHPAADRHCPMEAGAALGYAHDIAAIAHQPRTRTGIASSSSACTDIDRPTQHRPADRLEPHRADNRHHLEGRQHRAVRWRHGAVGATRDIAQAPVHQHQAKRSRPVSRQILSQQTSWRRSPVTRSSSSLQRDRRRARRQMNGANGAMSAERSGRSRKDRVLPRQLHKPVDLGFRRRKRRHQPRQNRAVLDHDMPFGRFALRRA